MLDKKEIEDTVKFLHKILLKCHEVKSILRDGKTIVAGEKFDGVIRNITQLLEVLQSQLELQKNEN